ncbi:RNA-guided endonuclease InsQ/TnpB family protein [Nocardiopsis oceani]
MQLRYAFRVYPDAGQRTALAHAFGCARVVYNDALRTRETARAQGQACPKSGELSKLVITEAKKTAERAWLGEVSTVVLQQSLRDLDAACRTFFDGLAGKRPRMGAPRFKSRKDHRQSVRFTANARWKITDQGKLALPKIGEIKVKWSRALPSAPATVTLIKDSAGRYFASFVVETDDKPWPETTDDVGIDLGLGHFAVLSDGTKIDNPRFLRRAEKKLKKAQRNLSRKQKGSANRAKARVQVARGHTRVADERREFHHQLSTRIIRENQAVYVEDLCVKGLGRTRQAKSVHDAGWSAFVHMLEYKATRYGRTFARVGRFLASSQTCHVCWVVDGPKPLHVRTWTCSGCDTEHDRDVNASRVVLAAGRKLARGREAES